jgi:hypothetical protein
MIDRLGDLASAAAPPGDSFESPAATIPSSEVIRDAEYNRPIWAEIRGLSKGTLRLSFRCHEGIYVRPLAFIFLETYLQTFKGQCAPVQRNLQRGALTTHLQKAR